MNEITAGGENLRLFIGLPVEVREALAGAIKKTKIGADKRKMEINWVPTENFHITLNFLGSIASEQLSELRARLVEVAQRHPPFSIDLRGMGGFPDERHMRTLWVGVRKTRALEGLHDDLRELLLKSGFHQEERPYSPHLTIGKTRKARNATDLVSPFVRTRFGEIKIEALLLYESRQHGPHVSYEILERVPLQKGDSPPHDSGLEPI